MGGEGVEDIKKVIIASSLVVFLLSTLVLELTRDKVDTVQSLSEDMINQRVRIVGMVVWQKTKNGVTLGEVNTGVDRVRVFDPVGRKLTGNIFVGTVKEYKGKLELVLDE